MFLELVLVSFFIFSSLSFDTQNSKFSYFYTSSDKYNNYSDLKLFEFEGVDFRIVEFSHCSPITIIAPHAGRIEIGTSEIARSIAGNSLNLYLFEGIKKSENFSLHITSDHFDEPRALALIKNSNLGVSIHGFKDDDFIIVHIGGLNNTVGQQLAQTIHTLGIAVEFPSTKFKGESPDNIVNKAIYQGVQLELSSKLRKKLLENQAFMTEFSEAIRSTLMKSIKKEIW